MEQRNISHLQVCDIIYNTFSTLRIQDTYKTTNNDKSLIKQVSLVLL